MIQQFKPKGLRRLFESAITSGVDPQQVARIRRILALLEAAETLEDKDLPGLVLHPLKGNRKGTRAVKVSGNWRMTFKIQNGDAFDVHFEDDH